MDTEKSIKKLLATKKNTKGKKQKNNMPTLQRNEENKNLAGKYNGVLTCNSVDEDITSNLTTDEDSDVIFIKSSDDNLLNDVDKNKSSNEVDTHSDMLLFTCEEKLKYPCEATKKKKHSTKRIRRDHMGSSTDNQNTKQKKKKKKKSHLDIDKGNSEMVNPCTFYNVTETKSIEKSNVTIPDICKNRKLDDIKAHENDSFHVLHTLHQGTSDIKLKLKRQGIVPKYGKWKPDEIAQLNRNMENYLHENPVEDISRLIYPRTKEERRFRRSTQFIQRMCYGIRRMRTHIAIKVETHFSSFLHRGKYTEQEKQELKKLHRIHGNKWRRIGLLMNRVYRGMTMNYNRLISFGKRGSRWSREEDECLIKAVNSCLTRNNTVNWKAVSQIVATRMNNQCRTRWYSKCIQNSQSEDVVFDNKDIFKMIKIISESNVDDFYLIDWFELAEHFNSSVSMNFLKWKFGAISKEISNSHLLEFEDLIEQLYVTYSKKISESDSSSIVVTLDDSITDGDNDNVIVID